jgi:glycosyltransferase involved in cell wall biosynthesis
MDDAHRTTLLVLASTYPRWRGDPEPGFVHELCRRLTGRFHVIALVPDAPDADPSGDLDGVQVVRFRYAPRSLQTLVNHGGIVGNLRHHPWKWLLVPGFVLGQYWAARRLIRRQSVDVVHAHWLIPQGLIAQRLQRVAKLPYVVTSHGGDLFGLRGRLLEKLKRQVAGASAAMTVVSSAMREEAHRIGLQPPKLAVLPMGVDLRERFVVNPDVPRVDNELLFVGRLVAKKGLPMLLQAMPQIVARRPQTMLTIAGFGPEEPSLRAQARSLGVEDKVNFLGAMPQDRLPELYRRATVFVAPFIRDESGNQEGLPVVLMEAIGCGCPVVVGEVAGIRDLLGDAAKNVCVDPTNISALADAVLQVLEQPLQAQQQAHQIRQAVADRIDWAVIADGYAQTIETCFQHAPSQEAHP